MAEGQRVDAGELLIRLDQTRTRADLEQLRSARLASEALAARLRAERDGLAAITWPEWPDERDAGPQRATLVSSQLMVFEARRRAQAGQIAVLKQKIAQSNEEIAGLEGEIDSQEQQLALLKEEIADFTVLLNKGLVDKPRVLALRRHQAEVTGERRRNQAAIARARQVIAEAEIRIAELETARVNEAADELQEVEREMFQLAERVTAAEDVLRRTEIRAPLAGRVVGLKVHTLGGVIGAGEPLMDIVPDHERLLVDVQIDPNDIDAIEIGQTAELRLSAYHQRDLPPLEGRLVSVSADRLIEEQTGRAYYLGRIALTEDPLRVLDGVEIVPGMQADAIILTGGGRCSITCCGRSNGHSSAPCEKIDQLAHGNWPRSSRLASLGHWMKNDVTEHIPTPFYLPMALRKLPIICPPRPQDSVELARSRSRIFRPAP